MRNTKTTKEVYEQLMQMPELHSLPELQGEILFWNLYENAYIRAYCDSYDTGIDVIRTSSQESIAHWHPDEDDMLNELYTLGKEGNILVLRKSLFGTGVFYMGEDEKYPYPYNKKRHFGELICLKL